MSQPSKDTTSTTLKPIYTWGKQGPNVFKIQMILETLKLPYTVDELDLSEVKTPSYLAVNPNGRVPAIHDPNTGLTLWESGAIITYLTTTYDKTHTISFPRDSPEHHQTNQWLHFQVSGQGPYFGQLTWFRKYHEERLPSAEARYVREINRVTGVIDTWLRTQAEKYHPDGHGDGPWLVGDRCTYADIAFVQWAVVLGNYLPKDELDYDRFPLFKAWLDRLKAREPIRKVLDRSGQK